MENTDSGEYWVYILECADGTYYTGSTNNLEQRIETHNKGKGAKYTATRRPVVLVFSERFPDKQAAMRRERQIKGWKRTMKEALIKGKDV